MSGSLGYLNIQLALDQAKFQSNLEKAQRKAKQFSERTTQYLNNIEKAAQSINNVTKRDLYDGYWLKHTHSIWRFKQWSTLNFTAVLDSLELHSN